MFQHRLFYAFCLSGLFAIGFPGSAAATDFYVDAVQGSPSGDGSRDHPWQSIQDVIDVGLIRTQTWEHLPYEEGDRLVVIHPDAPVQPGDTIYLRDGYYGDLLIQSLYNEGDITIAAQPGHHPRLRTIYVQGGGHWVFRGLTISPSFEEPLSKTTIVFFENHGFQGPAQDILLEDCHLMSVEDSSGWSAQDWNDYASNGVRADGDRITIKGCHLLNVDFGITLSGEYSVAQDNVIENFSGDGMRGLGNYERFEHNVVKNCYDVNDNHDDGFQSWSVGPDGVGTGEVVGVELLGNVIINFEDPEQPFRGTLQGIGCFGGMYVDWVVENNVIIVDHYHGISFYGAVGCRIVNNTVFDPTPESPGPAWIMIHDHKDGTPSSDCIVRNNLAVQFVGMDSPGVTSDHNLIIDDPLTLFVDPTGYDFHLLPTAQAIDEGSPEDAPAEDIEGVSRPQGQAWDIGAYEYHEGEPVFPDAGLDGGGRDAGGDVDALDQDGASSGSGSKSSGCGCVAAGRAPFPLPIVWFSAFVVWFRLKQRRIRSKKDSEKPGP